MRRFLVLIVVLLLLAMGGGSMPQPWTAGPPAHLRTVVDGNSTFALELFRCLKDREGNLILSPYSISTAMAMVYGGARGNTEKQIAATMHFDADQKKLHGAMAEIRKTLVGSAVGGKVELAIANGLWPQRNYGFRDDFLKLVQNNYGAAVEFVDFPIGSMAAVRKINAWTAQQTRNKITNALSPDEVTAQTRLVITNAIYFKGDWASQFPRGETKPEPFWITSERSVQAPMMRQRHVFGYSESAGVRLLAMPYRDGNLAMVVVLPDQRGGLQQIEKVLDAKKLTEWLLRMQPRTVDVLMPKFTVESRLSLTGTLQAMGMSDVFRERGDFTGMSASRPLFINAVEHVALAEVDEQGTVAAAATSFSFGCSVSPSPEPAIFHADHPFLFLIGDLRTHTILFLGRIANPAGLMAATPSG